MRPRRCKFFSHFVVRSQRGAFNGVICDNCRAVYKIPDEKLVKPVTTTCRQCGHRMLIPGPELMPILTSERWLQCHPHPHRHRGRSSMMIRPPILWHETQPRRYPTVLMSTYTPQHPHRPNHSERLRIKRDSRKRHSPRCPQKCRPSGTATHDPQAICPSRSWVSLWHFSVLYSSRLPLLPLPACITSALGI